MTIGARDLDVEDLGMAAEEVLDQQPVLQQREQQPVRVACGPSGDEAGLVSKPCERDVEALAEVVGAEVVEAGLGRACSSRASEREVDLRRPNARDAVEHRGDVRRELRVGEIVDADGSGASGGRVAVGLAQSV